jgi:hypothetical protein
MSILHDEFSAPPALGLPNGQNADQDFRLMGEVGPIRSDRFGQLRPIESDEDSVELLWGAGG